MEAASQVPQGCFVSVRLGDNLKQRLGLSTVSQEKGLGQCGPSSGWRPFVLFSLFRFVFSCPVLSCLLLF